MDFLLDPSFYVRAVLQGTPLLFGATGEILTEKSGNLNLGIPGIMYVGAISGFVGGYFYKTSVNSASELSDALCILIPLLCCLAGSLLVSLLYCFLTITLRANQNVTGLAITTFGVGVGNFFGGSIAKINGGKTSFVSLVQFSKLFKKTLPFAEKWGNVGTLFFSYGFMVYLALFIAVIVAVFLSKTRGGLHLRAVGENPATADAAGINVTRTKYLATCLGGMIAGLGGLYYIMDFSGGVWANNAFGDRGWLAIAIVIFAIWKPAFAIPGSYLFGALYILYNKINVEMKFQPLLQMAPYVMTIVVLVITSLRKKRENQPPASLGLSYFREER